MAHSTFKTMYLLSKSDLENRNDNNAKKNFKLSMQNRDICDGGMSVSVKPIKTRVRNKRKVEKSTNAGLNINDSEDGKDKILALPQQKLQQYPYAGFKAQPTELELGLRSGNLFKYPHNDPYNDDDDRDKPYEDSNFRENEDDNSPSNVVNLNNNSHKDDEADSTQNHGYGFPSNIDYINNDESEQIGQRSQRLRHSQKIKGSKIKRLQRGYPRKLKRKFLDNKRIQNISHLEELPHEQNDNQLMLQYEHRVAPEDEESPKEYINEEQQTKKFDDNQIVKSKPNLKKRKILDDVQKMKDDQWLGRIRSRLNDKRAQFKRKRDNIGYRINPDDISKSLIKPSDFTYLNKSESADYLDKWKSLKELSKKPFKNKRFKPYS